MNNVDVRVAKRLPAIRDTPGFELTVHLKADNGVTVIIGPSGAGKTLLLNCIGGFVRPDGGRIVIFDQVYYDEATKIHLPSQLRRCGYIFQDHALFPHMTVRENLRFAASLAPDKSGRTLSRHKRIGELLESFDLAELGDRKPAELSGGQKQRAALARLLVTEPRLLLLDEPSRALDDRLRQAFWELLRSVRERLAIPVFLISHDLEECFALADSVVVMDQGQVLQAGRREEVFTTPTSVEVARLLGVYDVAPAEVAALDPATGSSSIKLFGQQIEAAYLPRHLLGDKGFLCVRRSEVKLIPRESHEKPQNRALTNDQLSLRVQGRNASLKGVRLTLEGNFSVDIPANESHLFRDNEPVTLHIPRSALVFTER